MWVMFLLWLNYCICGSEEVMYLLILCVLFSWPVVIIFYTYFVAITCRWQGAVVPYVSYVVAVTVTM